MPPILVPLLLAASSAFAMVVDQKKVQSELQSAELEAVVTIESVDTVPDPVHQIFFHAKARVDSVYFQGNNISVKKEIEIRGPGGELGEKGIFISGLPRPLIGNRYHAFLNRKSDGTYEVTGLEFGWRPVVTSSRNWSRNRTDGSNGDGTGPYLYWADSYFPIPYYISYPTFAGHPDFVAAVDASFTTWRNVPDIKVEFVAMGCSTNRQNENDGINNVILMQDAWPFDPAAIAITRNFYIAGTGPKAGMILDSDILLNNVFHDFTTTNEDQKYDIQDIVTHESGHFLGLGHEVDPVDPDAVMYAVATPNEIKKRYLTGDDLAAIRDAYHGTGKKIGAPVTPCSVAKLPTSCGAVHSAAGADEKWKTFGFFFLLAGLPWLFRFFHFGFRLRG